MATASALAPALCRATPEPAIAADHGGSMPAIARGENLTTQDEQVAVFANAAAHLRPGGRFVLEVEVPSAPRIAPGEQGRIFDLSPGHVGIDTHDDPVGQLLSSHHCTLLDGQWVQASGQYRYVWPSELDLMARLAGLRVEARWAGWDRSPFTAASPSQVVVYAKPA
ncbi:hypothetical protein EAS64_13285 [Trebonia kvetii]|uniref:Class I SAM-dependent methyltransferase n=1 Tax=Trebonia kvetii TaxID=2480626 RepID=A0A6P2C7J3_9ACTN|nr:hypothetical protein [Trebonia kvetii]TVZ05503.1 hypothetical protein EAS64_13285 [Trebonia kvetii]